LELGLELEPGSLFFFNESEPKEESGSQFLKNWHRIINQQLGSGYIEWDWNQVQSLEPKPELG
jgi:hypothetical protein